MTTSKELEGRTAVVTGASSGIGRAIAERLGGAGAHVVLSGRTESAMKEAADRISTAGGSARVLTADIRDPAAVQGLVDAAVEDTGRLDLMVNNAGLSHPEPILEADPEGWRAMLETNVLGLLAGCQAAVRAMRACGAEGHIVNISSIAAQRPDSGVYGATKHAVNTISNSLRQELMDDTIQVVTVMPGAVATNFARNFDPEILEGVVAMSGVEAEVTKGERLPDEAIEAAQLALSDMLASPEDVADAVLYAVTRPARVHIAEIVVRPNKDLNL
ncbi:MAG: SDR family oxidoreductase [Acidimicrobiia bacterium]|nr:SDR family oxidoreductase [Acidimicrobiia bacterium]